MQMGDFESKREHRNTEQTGSILVRSEASYQDVLTSEFADGPRLHQELTRLSDYVILRIPWRVPIIVAVVEHKLGGALRQMHDKQPRPRGVCLHLLAWHLCPCCTQG
jgi:hypothetical protein